MVHHPHGPLGTRGGVRRGVTLFELLIVVVMIGILIGIAASRLDWGRYRADGVSRGILAEVSSAQRLAVSLQEDVILTMPDSGRLQVHEDRDNDGAIGTGERVRTIVLDDRYRFGQSTAAELPSPADPTPLTSLTFRRDGAANHGGTFYIYGPEADPDCRHCRAITVNRATGRAVIYSHSTGAWRRIN